MCLERETQETVSLSFFRIRAGWLVGETHSPDLALATLSREIKFNDFVRPVCVPNSATFPDHPAEGSGEDMMAFVAGWGAAYSTCDTNDYGPTPHTQCKFPFVFKGKEYKRYSTCCLSFCFQAFQVETLKPISSCSTSRPPSAHNKVCRQFFRWSKKVDPKFDEHDSKKV